MKKLAILAAVIMVGGIAYASSLMGYGASVTVTVTPQQVALDQAAYKLAVVNNGTNAVYALGNCTEAEFTNAVAQGTAIVVPASGSIGNPYTFDAQGDRAMSSVYLRTVAGSSAVLIQAF